MLEVSVKVTVNFNVCKSFALFKLFSLCDLCLETFLGYVAVFILGIFKSCNCLVIIGLCCCLNSLGICIICKSSVCAINSCLKVSVDCLAVSFVVSCVIFVVIFESLLVICAFCIVCLLLGVEVLL